MHGKHQLIMVLLLHHTRRHQTLHTLLSPGNLFQTTVFRRSAKSTISTLTSCIEYSNIITVTVLPEVVGGTISPTMLTICSGEVPPQLNVQLVEQLVLGFPIIGKSPTDGVSFTSISTATGQSYTPSALNTTTFYRRVTTAGSGTASTCVAESSIIEIKVFDLDAGALDPSLICLIVMEQILQQL